MNNAPKIYPRPSKCQPPIGQFYGLSSLFLTLLAQRNIIVMESNYTIFSQLIVFMYVFDGYAEHLALARSTSDFAHTYALIQSLANWYLNFN